MLFLRGLNNATRSPQLAVNNHVGCWAAYRYILERLAVQADHSPEVHTVLTAASMAAYNPVKLNGTMTSTSCYSIAIPTRGVDL